MTNGEAIGGPAAATSWRELIAFASDLAFETDRHGRLVFIAPDPALGWPAAALLGQPAEMLLVMASDFDNGLNPFRPLAPMRNERARLRHSEGSAVSLSFAAAPLLDEAGRMIGARGFGIDVTEDEHGRMAATAALLRLKVLDDILWRLRQEVLPPAMVGAALSALAKALRAEGATIVRVPADRKHAQAGTIRHHVGADPTVVLQTVLDLVDHAVRGPVGVTAGSSELLACPCHTRFHPPEVLVLWRASAAGSWSAEERNLAISATALIRVVLEHEAIQQEMSDQSRNDPLTGLSNRRAFLDELARRIDRLEREELPGTLLIIDVDDLDSLNERAGLEAGDAALCGLALLLRATFRPADLLGRLGGDEFAVWLDGADDLAAAERAETLRLESARKLAGFAGDHGQSLSVSIAIGTRWPGRGEEIDMLIYRVDRLLGEITPNRDGQWRVSRYGGE
jgi:diguanylate cyclase (GGDEF)-like protein